MFLFSLIISKVFIFNLQVFITVPIIFKFKYIDIVRKEKDILKINKIRPLSEVEDDLANKNKISLKTFIALCLIEKMS